MKGRHTYDAIASALDDVHAEYGIRRKVVRTTTDNGSNFVKAFTVYSEPRAVEETTTEEGEDHNDGEDGFDSDATEPVDVYATLSEGESLSDNEYLLPPHQRCACHTLNLIATTDAEKAEADAAYKKVFRSTFAKCHALWNKYGRSAMAVEAVTDAYGVGLKRPNATRWNSVFMATERLLRLIKDRGDDEFRNVCTKLDVAKFTNTEVAFLEDYVCVMKPVAQALNILQAETKMHMGYLLPMICILKEKLQNLEATSPICKPLIAAMLAAVDGRFAGIFVDKEAIAAAILHPHFRTTWTDNAAIIDLGLIHIRMLLRTTATTEPKASTGTDHFLVWVCCVRMFVCVMGTNGSMWSDISIQMMMMMMQVLKCYGKCCSCC